MATIDHDFVEYIVKSLVGQPDDVKIERTVDEKGVLLTLSVADDDLGRVIGKRGATAQSLRTLLRALGTKNEARYNLKISDGGSSPPNRSRRAPEASEPAPEPESFEQPPAPVVDEELRSDFASDETDSDETDSDETDSDETDSDQPVAAETEQSADEDQDGDSLAQTKKELADLDDLDI